MVLFVLFFALGHANRRGRGANRNAAAAAPLPKAAAKAESKATAAPKPKPKAAQPRFQTSSTQTNASHRVLAGPALCVPGPVHAESTEAHLVSQINQFAMLLSDLEAQLRNLLLSQGRHKPLTGVSGSCRHSGVPFKPIDPNFMPPLEDGLPGLVSS